MIAHYGYSREEFLSMTVLDIRPAEDVDDFTERFSTLAPGYRKESKLLIHRKKDGTHIKVLNTSHDITFNGRKARIVLINDVTERLRVEEERETLLSALRESLKARDEFLSMASHELKTPITSLILNYESVESAKVIGDPFRLEKVVKNLFSNAVKYGDHRPVSVMVKKTETQVCLIVEDQGKGISPADQKRIFKRFERAVSRLGLGLTIIKEISTLIRATSR